MKTEIAIQAERLDDGLTISSVVLRAYPGGL